MARPSLRKRPAVAVGGDSQQVVIVGLASDVPRALEHPVVGRGFAVAGVVVVSEDDAAVREHAESLHALLVEHKPSTVMVAGPLGAETMRAVSDLSLLHRCRLLAVMPSEVMPNHDPRIVWEGEAPLVQLATRHRNRFQAVLKRGIDLVAAAAGLALLSPVMFLSAVAIKLESPGPALFLHWRVGRDGRPFACLKFRTMREDAEATLENDANLKALYRAHNYKLPEELDPRVTSLGRVLRRTSLDELPQLINVLRGEMSLVGPRPVVQEELEHYRGSERLLLSVRPGMTGAWAVSGRHHVGYPARAEIELGYVRGWRLGRDVQILVGTVGAVMDPGSDARA